MGPASPRRRLLLWSSLGAMLRISVRRSRADWPIVAAAGLICLLAATLLAAGSIYAGAVSTAGLHRVLADAPVDQANIDVSFRAGASEAPTADAAVTDVLQQALEPIGGSIQRVARSDSFALPEQPAGDVLELAVLGYAEGLADNAGLVAGAWPVDDADGASVPVAVSEDVAKDLGLEVGDRFALPSRVESGFVVPVAISGIFHIDDPSSAFWFADPQAIDGQVASDRFVTNGPFYTTEANLLTKATGGQTRLEWRAYPAANRLSLGDTTGIASRVDSIRDRLRAALGSGVTVQTGLPEILRIADRSLLVSRTGVLLLTVQLVVLAAYAVLLSGSLLIEHRRVDTAMLRSRGAGPWRILGLAVIEGLILVVPAALAAPWVAAVALRVFNLTGPLADIGLVLDPAITVEAYVAACAAALTCLAALTLPAFRNARSFAAVHSKLVRGETASIGQRLGLDIALLAIAGVGLWQLRQYGAPLTLSVHWSLGLDPLLVATPAIGLLAGAVLALRIVPLLAQLIERATAGHRGLVTSLGARQLARRPLRYTRAALLLMLAMAMGVFAVCYTVTWTISQHDQASFQVGADLRVTPGTRQGSIPRWGVDQAYAALPGVTARVPVERDAVRVVGTGGGEIVGLDAETAAQVTSLRPDLSNASMSELLSPLAAGRPDVAAVRLPDGTRRIRFEVDLRLKAVERQEIDDATGSARFVPTDIESVGGWRGLGLSAVVRDARGMLYRFGSVTTTLAAAPVEMTVPLGDSAEGGAPSFAYPLDLLAVELSISLPEGYQAPDATVSVEAAAAAASNGAWQPLALDIAKGWRSSVAFFGRPHRVAESNLGAVDLTADAGTSGIPVLPGVDRFGRATVLTFGPAALETIAEAPIPIVASAPFLGATASAVGDDLSLTIDGVRRTVAVTGAIRAVPGSNPDAAVVLMDLPTLSLLRYEGNDAVTAADEWWLAVEDDSRAAITEALSSPPIGSASVVGVVERNRQLATDPVALGMIGALGIGFVAAALFAVVGFAVSAAVSARERITEFALLRALGLAPNQLSVWLSLENAALALVSLVSGTVLGLVIAWAVLPFITVTQGATTPFPPVAVQVPWGTIAQLVGITLIALGATVVALGWLLRRIGLASVLRMSED